MNKRIPLLPALSLAALTACSSGTSATPASASLSERAVQAVTVEPNSLTFTQQGAAYSQTFRASTQFAGDITAISSNSNCATVDPPDQDVSTPPTSPQGVKSATFTVTPVGPGRCTITVTDKKGNTAAVTVLIFGN